MRLFGAGILSTALAAGALAVMHAQPGCEFRVTPVRVELDGAARAGTVAIETQPGCGWTADTSFGAYEASGWLHISPSSGSGSGTVVYQADAATGGNPLRQGFIRIRWNTPTAGVNVVVTQTSGACSAAFFPAPGPLSARTVGWKGGSRSLWTLADPPFSGPWRFVAAPDWIGFFNPPLGVLGHGDGAGSFGAAPNPSRAARDGVITFCSGAPMTVHQSGRTINTGQAAPSDFDGDGISDPAVYRPSTGKWFVLRSLPSSSAPVVGQWGTAATIPMPGDFDGDNVTELAVYDPQGLFGAAPAGNWNMRYSSNGYDPATQTSYPFPTGTFAYTPQSLPLMADFNGDGGLDLVNWRPDTGNWSVTVTNPQIPSRLPDAFNGPDRNGQWQWGLTGDVPLPADFDGDGFAELAVWRPSNGVWYLRLSSRNYDRAQAWMYPWGVSGDRPIAGDFDGDHRADLAVWRPSNGTWYIVFSSSGYQPSTMASVQWGLPGDVPVAGDYDGDGRTDLAVWRPSNGTWYILSSSSAYNRASARTIQWGLPGDVPLSARITRSQ